MLTIFAIPKHFRGHIAVTQRNAIRSWTLLRPACEVILMGNEEGTAETAEEFGLRHVAEIARNKFGTPLVSDLFQKAQHLSRRNFFCYVNSDIVFMSDFTQAWQRVIDQKSRFLFVGHRWNLDLDEALEFEANWEAKLRDRVKKDGKLAYAFSIDYFVFPRDLLGEIPPFAIGRPRWDNWMLYRARCLRMPLIDATPVMMAVHQNHDYAHHPQGKDGVSHGDEAVINEKLAGGLVHWFTLDDANYLLTPEKLRRKFDRAHFLRECEKLPALYPWPPLTWIEKAVITSRPFRSRFGLSLGSFLRGWNKIAHSYKQQP